MTSSSRAREGLPDRAPQLSYERQLRHDPRWALVESTRFFAGMGGLHETLRELKKRFDELGISYVVIGGMALTAHGYARMAENIDVLVSREDLKKVHEHLVGRGYARVFAGSKNIRDAATRVKIEFLFAGQFPGSGEPQPVSFPDPADTESVERDGVNFIGLARLVELELASGMTGGVDRARDLVEFFEYEDDEPQGGE